MMKEMHSDNFQKILKELFQPLKSMGECVSGGGERLRHQLGHLR